MAETIKRKTAEKWMERIGVKLYSDLVLKQMLNDAWNYQQLGHIYHQIIYSKWKCPLFRRVA